MSVKVELCPTSGATNNPPPLEVLESLTGRRLSNNFFFEGGGAQWSNSGGQAVITSWEISVGSLRTFKGARGQPGVKCGPKGANELPGPRGFQISVTLGVLLTFLKSGDFSGHLKAA